MFDIRYRCVTEMSESKKSIFILEGLIKSDSQIVLPLIPSKIIPWPKAVPLVKIIPYVVQYRLSSAKRIFRRSPSLNI